MNVEELPKALVAAFPIGKASKTPANEGVAVDGVDEACSQWELHLRNAFYGAASRAKRDAPSNKFLGVETALMAAFEQLQHHAAVRFWGFIVSVVLALSRDEPATSTGQLSSAHGALPSDSYAPGQPDRTRKAARPRTQPNTPLASVMVSALKKWTELPGCEEAKQLCVRQGRTNEELLAFCTSAMNGSDTMDQKLLVEILDLFRVENIAERQLHQAADTLLATKSHSALIKLCQAFPDHVDWDFAGIMRAMITSKDWGAAELVARTFEAEGRTVLSKIIVEEAITHQEFKRAHRIVYKFNLQQEFPDIDMLYNRDALIKLIEKQRWTLALSFVGSDITLQTLLLNHIVAVGKLEYASFIAKERLGLLDFEPDEALARAAANRSGVSVTHASLSSLPLNGYVELELPQSNILFCASEPSVRDAFNHFFPAKTNGSSSSVAVNGENAPQIVGLDVEWKPTSSKIASSTGVSSTIAIASILQVATSSRVYIFDLLELHECSYLFEVFLARLFMSDDWLKVGFGFDSDLKVLHQTFPERSVFRSVSPFLELSLVTQKAFGASTGSGLSAASTRILGKPLDKRMQLSNWDDRPLSEAQLIYAALDAYCLVQIVQQIRTAGLNGESADISWEDVVSQQRTVALSSVINDDAGITKCIADRRAYQLEWHRKRHSVAESTEKAKALITTEDVRAFWENRVSVATKQCDVVSSDADANAITSLAQEETHKIQLLPMHEVSHLVSSSPQDAENAHGTNDRYIVINSICFFANERPCVACIDANAKLDTSRLAALCGVSRRKIKLATAMECESIWGFAPGTVAPFGHNRVAHGQEETSIPIFVDSTLHSYGYWLSGSGSHGHVLLFRSSVFFDVIDVHSVSDISLHRGGGPREIADSNSSTSARSIGIDTPQAVDNAVERKFLADSMVARVGRWMRTIGIDVILWDDAETALSAEVSAETAPTPVIDRKSALVAWAAQEQRIVITRDKRLADRRDAGACFVVSSDDPHVQFREIRTHFALELNKEEMMTRCARCNHKGFTIVDREYVRLQQHDVVHPNVLAVVSEFFECCACRKLFWVGPKYSSAYENMLHMFKDADVSEPSVI